MSDKQQAVNIVLWSKQGCHYCQEIKDYLQEENLSYELIDVTENDQFRDILNAKYGVSYVPVVEIGQKDSKQYQGIIDLGLEHVVNGLKAAGIGVK